jgi:YfiR/HmsC-like
MTRHPIDILTSHAGRLNLRRAVCIGAHFLTALVTFVAVAHIDGATSFGQEIVDSHKEYNVKAVTLYAFGRYVTWPDSAFASADAPFVIGILGENPFGDALTKVAAKKTVGGRPIVVRQLTSPSEYAHCHILFVAGTVGPETEAKVFRAIAGKAVLLVGESSGFAERGGIVNFYQSGSNVRFELNPDKANEAQLGFDAKLLSLGSKVASRN